jgi:hypothetical protein
MLNWSAIRFVDCVLCQEPCIEYRQPTTRYCYSATRAVCGYCMWRFDAWLCHGNWNDRYERLFLARSYGGPCWDADRHGFVGNRSEEKDRLFTEWVVREFDVIRKMELAGRGARIKGSTRLERESRGQERSERQRAGQQRRWERVAKERMEAAAKRKSAKARRAKAA